VLDGLRGCYAKLRLKVHEIKTAVAQVWGRKFLGYSLWLSRQAQVRLAVAGEAVQRYSSASARWRQTGRSMGQIAQDLQAFLPGWKAYFQLAQTPKVWRGLDEWMRRRLRAIQLKFWGRGTTMYRELRSLGASRDIAAQVAGNACRWWYNCSGEVNRVLTIAYFDRLGVPRLC
jgi:RNA-directed DNA polymerase